MFKTLCLIASLVSAAAFAPVSNVRFSALRMSFTNELGAQPPLGFWDPLGLVANADQERFDRLRTVENKHGRISQLAILGHLVTSAGGRWSGDIAFGLPFSEMKTGLAAFETIPTGGIYQIVCFVGLMEIGFSSIQEELAEFCETKYPALASDKRKAIELNNGRAAQMGILALMVHEKLNNDPYVINSLLGAPVPFNQ